MVVMQNYTYQWEIWNGASWDALVNGGVYAGVKTNKLELTAVDKATYDGKQYRCVVNTDGGVCVPSVNSTAATLTINAVDKIVNQPKADDVCIGNPAEITIEGTAAATSFVWEFNDGSGFKNIVGHHGMSSAESGNVSTLTIPNATLAMNTWQFKCTVGAATGIPEPSQVISIRVLKEITVSTVDATFEPCLNEVFSLSVEATDGDDIKYKWYEKTTPGVTLSETEDYNFGNISLADEGVYVCEIYNDEHCSDKSVEFTVDVKEPATVTDPSDLTMCVTDGNPTFTVTGGGDDITYKWYRDGVAIASTNSNTYTETAPANGQTFYCQVSNSCETVNSKSATLTVIENVDVTDPIDLTIADGANAEFSVVASGEPNYSYQWQEKVGAGTWTNISNGGKYAGATSEKLVITNALKAAFNGNQYRCIVETDGTVCIPNATSEAATLSINDVVKIVADAHDAEVCFNDNAVLTVEGTNDALTFTWEYDKGSGWTSANGADGMTAAKAGKVSTLTIPCDDLDINNWKFRCLVSDALSTDVYTSEVKVRVLEDITASAVDAAPSVCENLPVTLEVNTSGDDILYKWFKDSDPGTTLSTNSTYTINNVALADEGAYSCRVYNLKLCSDITVNFTIDVKEFVTVTNPSDMTICETDAAPKFTVAGSGEPGFTYQWYNKDGIIAGETSHEFTAVSKEDGQSYYAKVIGECNTVTSNAASLTVVENLAVTDPVDVTIADGDNAEFSVTASGEPNYSYQWQVLNGASWDNLTNVGIYSGVNTDKLLLTKADRATYNGKKYRCVVNTDGGVCIATVTVFDLPH
jgi:YHS domain-containing protein